MVVPIIIIYGLGFIFLIFTIEGNGKQIPQDLAYPALSFFVNVIGYYISYSDADYTSLAYLPIAMLLVSVLYIIYRVYQVIPKESPWGDSKEPDEYKKEMLD